MNDLIFGDRTGLDDLRFSLKTAVWSAASRFALSGLCGWEFERDWIAVSRNHMALQNLPTEFEGLRVAHISDIHCSPLMRERHLLNYVDMINSLEPDIVAVTGDFITASTRHYARRAGQILSRLRPRKATLACLGNHDYGLFHPQAQDEVRGLGRYVADQLRNGGVRVLVNERYTMACDEGELFFAGVGELWTNDYDVAAALGGIPSETPIVALCHNPDAATDLAANGADYILAGHTHGRANADNVVSRLLFPAVCRDFVAGEYDLGEGKRLYVNRGLGHAARSHVDSRPEIAMFTLRRATSPETPTRAEIRTGSMGRRPLDGTRRPDPGPSLCCKP